MLVMGFNANASLISVDISDTSINVGDTISVTINAVDFEATENFAFDFSFMGSIFNLDSSSMISDLAIVGPVSGLDGISIEQVAAGLIGFDFVNFFSGAANPAGDFVIAAFNLTAIAQDINTFDLTNFWSDGASSHYDTIYTSGDQVTVSAATAVPEPTSILLMLAGVMLISARRKFF